MQTGGFTETIWHFAGYLHIADALARSPIVYDGDPQRPLPEDPSDPVRGPIRGVDFDELVSLPTVVTIPPFDNPQSHLPHLAPAPFQPLQVRLLAPPPAQSRLHVAQEDGGGGGAIGFRSVPRVITVEYKDGGTENLIEIRQVNQQSDQDLVTSDGLRYADGSVVVPAELHLDAEFAALVAQADTVAPDGLPDLTAALTYGPDELIAMVAARSAQWAETGSPNPDGSPAMTMPAGRFVDGVASAAEPHEPGLPEIAPWRLAQPAVGVEAEATHSGLQPTGGVATLAETGLNSQINAAAIVDVNEAVGSMMVGGNYFYSRGIVQVNILVDNDTVDIATSGGIVPAVATAGNEVHNIAEFVTLRATMAVQGAAATPHWTVDVVSGDFYDVKSIVQFNGLNDSDRTVQVESGTYFDLRTGANTQINLAEVSGFDQYDIIVIGGNYYRADWIYQYNIVLDPDRVTTLAPGEAGDAAAVTTGFNALTNIASIETQDALAFKPMLQAHHDLMTMLGDGVTVLTPNADWRLYGDASGTLKILYVPGDYYDLNAITQVNFLIDGDQTIQAGAHAGTVQGAAAGGNSLLNEAVIVDPGLLSLSNYLGGDAYEESVLIQVNMITDSDTVHIHDTQTLVPELVAFAAQAEAEPEPECPVCQTADPAQHDHLMSNMLA